MRKKLLALLLVVTVVMSIVTGCFRPKILETHTDLFYGNDVYGHEISPENFPEAKLYMINFWAPWCGPCISEMPDLDSLNRIYGVQGLQIIGVTVSGDKDEVMDVVTSMNITYPIIDMCDSLSQYNPTSIPTTYFFDAEGNLLSYDPYVGSKSYSTWQSIIESYLMQVS